MNPSRYHPISQWGIDVVETDASGSAFINLNDQDADQVTILVPSSGSIGLDLQSAHDLDSSKYVSLDAPSGITIALAGNAKEVLVRRTDQSATPANVRYIWRKYQR